LEEEKKLKCDNTDISQQQEENGMLFPRLPVPYMEFEG
jgi:hypothetical protein